MDTLLDEDLIRYVKELVDSGRFSSERAVVEAALRQMRDKSEKKAQIRRMMLEQSIQDAAHLTA